MMPAGAIRVHRILQESILPFGRAASNIVVKACLECVAMAGVLLVAILTTLILGL